MRPLRVYVDTSVIGGCEDREFAAPSRRFFDHVRHGRVTVLVSQIVIAELAAAPSAVQILLPSLPEGAVEILDVTPEILSLRDRYVEAGIVGPRWADDAAHVAAATVARVDAIVSWNFRHLVRLDKMRAYNQINLLNGYGIVTIVSPLEVAFDDGPD